MRAAAALIATALSTLAAAPATTAGTAPRDAVAVTWLSTGDSYSSGEGVRGNEGDCAQSHRAWGPQAAALLRSQHGWDIDTTVFAACTGHLVEDFYNARRGGKDSLWEWALTQPGSPGSERFDVITMSFGGNDIGFAEVIVDCLAAPIVRYTSLAGLVELGGRGRLLPARIAGDVLSTASADWLPFAGESCSTSEQRLLQRVDWLFEPTECGADAEAAAADPEGGGRAWRGDRSPYDNYACELVIDHAAGVTGSLPEFWRYVLERSVTPDGVLVVQGYPRLFAESSEWGLHEALRCSGITRGDANMLGRVAVELDRRMAHAVADLNRALGRERVVYSSVIDLYRDGGHSLCGDGEDWINRSITLTRDEPFLVAVGRPVATGVAVNPAFRFRHLGAFHPKEVAHAAEANKVAHLLAARGLPRPETAGDAERAGFVGAWAGRIQGPSTTFEAVLSLDVVDGRLAGTIEHPDLPCTGTLSEVSLTGNVGVFRPHYTAESRCVHEGTHRFTVNADGTLGYEWLHPTSSRIDSGTLRPLAEPSGSGAISRSVHTSGAYVAELLAVTPAPPHTVTVDFRATGPSDLRRPEQSCAVHSSGLRAPPIDTSLTLDVSGHYEGRQTYALAVPGTWSLRYSCRTDYSDAPLFEADGTVLGISTYSDHYYAAVLSAHGSDGATTVRFAAVGNPAVNGDLRDPTTSCIVADGTTTAPASVTYDAEVAGRYYAGTLTFPGELVGGTFVYSCRNDYSSVALAGG